MQFAGISYLAGLAFGGLYYAVPRRVWRVVIGA